MKKLIAALVASSMVLGSASVMAADSSVEDAFDYVELNWEDVIADESAAEIIEQGSFQTFDEVAVTLWVPDSFTREELTDDLAEEGFIACFSDENGYQMNVTLTDAGLDDLEGYAAALAEDEDVTNVVLATLNGLGAVSYDMEENDASVVSVLTESGRVVEFIFSPMSDEDYAAASMLMVASIMAEEDAVESGAEEWAA